MFSSSPSLYIFTAQWQQRKKAFIEKTNSNLDCALNFWFLQDYTPAEAEAEEQR